MVFSDLGTPLIVGPVFRPLFDKLKLSSQKLFEELLGLLQSKLSVALQEVLGQRIEFVAEADFKRGSAVVEFSICRGQKLAFIIDSTSSPVAILIPFIGWGVYIMSLIQKEFTALNVNMLRHFPEPSSVSLKA